MLSGNLPGDSGQAFEMLSFVLEQALSGHHDPVLALSPFTQQHCAGSKLKLLRTGAQLDLRVLSTDGL